MKKLAPEDLTPRERKAMLGRYLERVRGRAQIRPAPRANAAIGRIVRPLSKNFGHSTSELGEHWGDIVGPRLARLSRPLRLAKNKDSKALVVSASGPAAALISAQSAQILAAANRYLGLGTVTKLKIQQNQIHLQKTPVKRPQLQRAKPIRRGLTPTEDMSLRKGLEKIENTALKEALEALGRGVISRQPQSSPRKANPDLKE